MNTIQDTIRAINEGQVLNAVHTESLFDAVFQGGVSEIELSAILASMKIRKETPEEIIGAARSMRKFAERLDIENHGGIDTCGTGGDYSHSFNISTAVALVLAAAGIPVTKHGNRSVSSRSGSADFLESLGVPIGLTGDEAVRYFREHRFVFMFAPNYHPAMKHAGPVRKALGVRTIFNFLGPVTNPAMPKRQMIGVFSPDFLPLYSQVVAGLGYERVLLYSAEGGMDEVSPVNPTMVYEVAEGNVRFYTILPEKYLKKGDAGKIPENLSADENAELFIETISSREPTPLGRLLALNTALAMYLAGEDRDFNTSFGGYFSQALEIIHSGEVLTTLERLRSENEGQTRSAS
ncbi:MAG TPA: anthranilate phosphoribosyltransferase [Spirochaetota bacterium]|nr:anthranilate phosphoribosyltransferase [Spirochaetota bacterium]